MNPLRRRSVLLLFGAVLLAGCRERGDPVRRVLDRIADAARGRDSAAASRELASDYRDASGNGRADVERLLRGYFAAYEIVDVTVSHVTIERAEGAARARFRAALSGQPRQGAAALLPSSAAYLFDVRLVPDGSRWKVAWASWQPEGS